MKNAKNQGESGIMIQVGSCLKKLNQLDWAGIGKCVLVLLALASLVCCIVDLSNGSATFDVVGAMFINSLVALIGFMAIYISVENDRKIKQFEYII